MEQVFDPLTPKWAVLACHPNRRAGVLGASLICYHSTWQSAIPGAVNMPLEWQIKGILEGATLPYVYDNTLLCELLKHSSYGLIPGTKQEELKILKQA